MAAHVSNFKQENNQILTDLLNEQNTQELVALALTFGVPAETVPGEIATDLTVTAATGSGYKGSVAVKYNRVPLSFMNTNEPDLLLETEATTTHGLLDALNATFGIQLVAGDIADTPLPSLEPDAEADAVLTATADTLVWHGSVTLKITASLVDLNTVYTTTTLDGLYPPAAIGE